MSFTSAFLAGFASTALEQQKRAMEQRQFDATLAIQQAALQTQQQKFDQEMALREAERQDRLQQNKVENQISSFRAQTEAASVQDVAATRKAGLAEKAREHDASIEQKQAAIRNDPKILDMQRRIAIQKQYGVDTSQLEQQIAQRYQELGGEPQGAGGGPLTGQAPQGQPQATPEALGGQGQATPAAPAPEAPAARGGPPPQAGTQAIAPASQTTSPLQEFPAANPQEEERLNKIFKENDIPRVAVSPQTKEKTKREEAENRFKTAVAQGQLAGMPEQKGTIEDVFRQHGLDVDINVHQKGTNVSSRRAGGHVGALLLGSGLSFGGTEGHSEQTLPYVDMYPKSADVIDVPLISAVVGKPEPEDRSVNSTAAMANALWDASINKNIEVSQPYVVGMQDVMRDRISDTLGKYGKADTIEAKPFDGVNEPKRHQAARAAVALTHADEQLRQVSEKNGVPYVGTGVPKVQDAETDPVSTLRLYGKAVDKLDRVLPNLNSSKGEGPTIQELATRLKPDQNGQFSPETVQAAKEALQATLKADVSDQFKQAAQKILKPIADQPVGDRAVNRGNIAGGFKAQGDTLTPTKATSQAEEKPSGGGAMNMRGALTLSALGGLSQFGAEKATGGTAPENVTAANKAFGSVTQKTKDKAETAVADVKGQFGRMADDEKQKVQSTWKARRAVWKNYGIKESILKDMNEAVGLDRNDGF